MKRVIRVTFEDRDDGGLRAYSDDLPGLVLSHRDRAKLMGDVEPAVKTILQHRGESTDVRIDGIFIRSNDDGTEGSHSQVSA